MNNNKIFCIGLNKTGTTSLNKALKICGFNSVHFRCGKGKLEDIILKNYLNDNPLLSGIGDYDAYIDWNNSRINLLYKILDKQYPNSKFILTTRNLNDWLKSRERHVKKLFNLKDLQRKYPDSDWYNVNKTAWIKEWKSLHKDIKLYFQKREGDLLIFPRKSGHNEELVLI